jgi:hypothetical protein
MLDFVLSLLGQLLGAEFGAKCPQIADKLIANAVQKLPASLQERMYEEWCAVLNDTPGDLSKLAVAISLYWKRSKIGDQWEETAASQIPALAMDALSDTEDAVFELTARGMSNGEICNRLGINRTAVEYNKITCAQKLSGQTSIGRKDVISFFGRYKYDSYTYRKLIIKLRRERAWREWKTQNSPSEWKRNGGW